MIDIKNASLVPQFKQEVARQPLARDVGAAESLTLALLHDAVRVRASDIHLDSMKESVRLRFRIDGSIVHVADLAPEHGQRLIGYLKTNAGMDPAPVLKPEDSHIAIAPDDEKIDVRIACAPCVTGEKVTMRLLRGERLGFKLGELGLSDSDAAMIGEWMEDVSGILLVVGPIGSGKTTTLYSLLGEMDLIDRNVFTVEDPIEYQIEGINHMQVNPARGVTFDSGLRAILRHDPDCILLGEIRDDASADAALDAANVGHVVLSTMHSRDAASVVTTLRILGFEDHEIANSLTFVVAQRLVRKLCNACKEDGKPRDRDVKWLTSVGIDVPESVGMARGCQECNGTGYHGQTGVFELWPIDQEGYSQILDHADERTIRQTMRKRGLHSLLEDGVAKAAAGLVDLAELRRMGARSYLDRRF